MKLLALSLFLANNKRGIQKNTKKKILKKVLHINLKDDNINNVEGNKANPKETLTNKEKKKLKKKVLTQKVK